jgi:acyl-CoA synthetase (AMP-forming)/AMP-acid ligase II
MGLTTDDRLLAPLPLFHINPMGFGIIGCLTAGCDVLSMKKFSASGFWPVVHEQGITALTLHAPPIEILKRATTAADAAGHSVRTQFFADAAFMETFSIPHAVSVYGSTEAAGITHMMDWNLGDEIPGDASRWGGFTRHDIESRIDDAGYIYVRGLEAGALFNGYFADGRLDPALDAEGWFATGDIGRLDETSGALVFIERGAESIRVKGEFVPIPFIEEKLGTIAELDDFALWKTTGELVDDEVVLYAVAQDMPVESIQAVCRELPAFMRPTRLAEVRSIPRDAGAGKVQRRLLTEQDVVSWTVLS